MAWIGQQVRRAGVATLGAVLVAVVLMTMAALASLIATPTDAGKPAVLAYPGGTVTVMLPTVFVVVSTIGGALGGALHGVASLTAHVAAGNFDKRWTLWYLANPAVGAALATAFLFVLQAGLGGQSAPSAESGLYGVAGVATLVGLFSRHALEKLKEIFDVAFAHRRDLSGTAPTIKDLNPRRTPPNTPARLVVTGSGFAPGAVVEVGKTWLTPSSVTDDSMAVDLPAQLLSQAGPLPVRVRTGTGSWSERTQLEVQ